MNTSSTKSVDVAIRSVGRESGVAIGDTIDGRYRLIGELGQGGMGTVFLAEHVLIQRKLAIKVLHTELVTDKSVVDRFMNEAKAAGTLGHPNIIESTDMGFTREGVPFIVFEYLQGSLLSDEIYRCRGLPVRRALRIAHQIASALDAAHSASIIHRDLKTDNVFLTDRDEVADHVKVLDFGISRFLELDSSRARPGQLMGTPEFMSPEQILSPEDVDARADVYALGVILYEMLAGRCPFLADHDPHAVIHQVIHATPAPLGVPGLPPGLQEMILTKFLAKDPDARYQSMKDASGALEAFHQISRPMGTLPDIAMPPVAMPVLLPPAPVKRGRGLALLTLALLCGAAGGAMFYADEYLPAAPPDGAQAAVGEAATSLAAAIRDGLAAAQLRAEAVASTPMLRAAIETDAATLRDMAGDDFVFTPKPGETVEVFQLRDDGMHSLLRLPGTAPTITPLGGSATRVEATGDRLTVVASSPITRQAGGIGGALVIAASVDLAPIKRVVAPHVASASVTGLASPITLAGSAGTLGGQSLSIPVVVDGVAGHLSVTAVLAVPTSAPRFVLARTILWTLGAALFVIYLLRLLRKARP